MKKVCIPENKLNLLKEDWQDTYERITKKKIYKDEMPEMDINLVRKVLLESKFYPVDNLNFDEWVICLVEQFIEECYYKECVLCKVYYNAVDHSNTTYVDCKECPLTRKNYIISNIPNVLMCDSSRSPYKILTNMSTGMFWRIGDRDGSWWQTDLPEKDGYYVTTNEQYLKVMQEMYIKYRTALSNCIEWINIKVT